MNGMVAMFDRIQTDGGSRGPTRIDCYVGARIRMARERSAASVEDLATAVGASLSSIESYEAGVEKVGPLMLHRIATTLGVTLGSLFGMDAT